MKKITLFIVAMVAFVGTMVAALPITKVDRVNPTDEIFMEMAIDQAKRVWPKADCLAVHRW